MDYMNPFEYEAANKFTTEQILEFYIEDYNYSRFIKSRRNIVLVGVRGTGKTMTFLYNSFPVQIKIKKQTDIICIYIPCNTPLTHRQEYQLLDNFKSSVISEHFLVISIMYHIADTLSKISSYLGAFDADTLRAQIEYGINIDIPKSDSFFESLKLAFQKENRASQMAINTDDPKAFYRNAIGFSSGVIPLLTCFKKIPALKNSHFALMLDDAHDLNEHQIKVLNSWIAYRDNSLFSFKVAKSKVDKYGYKTVSGGTILEGHDFTMVDMEQPFQNRFSDFGKLARKVIKKRLAKIDINIDPEQFFPEHPQFVSEIERWKDKVKKEARKKYPKGTHKQKQDYVYKYARARYFGSRAKSKSNRPPYAGLDMIVHISTGVLRNLLEPCYWMYDRVYSESVSENGKHSEAIKLIKPTIQNEIIMDRSKAKWEWLREGLDTNIEGCSREQAKQLYQLFDNLAIFFRERLMSNISEPRAINFTVTNKDNLRYDVLYQLLQIARKAQLLYTYTSAAKDSGSRETYYVPNRILWPDRGLDPQGQHARVSITTEHLLNAACDNRKIPLRVTEGKVTKTTEDKLESLQGGLFNEDD